MSFSNIRGALASAVAPAGTFVVAYPTNKDGGNFYQSMGSKLTINGDVYFYPYDFNLTLGATASGVTVTNASAATWPANAAFILQLEEQGERQMGDVPIQFPNSATATIGGQSYSVDVKPKLLNGCYDSFLTLVSLGKPAVGAATTIALSQAISGASNAVINGALASGGVATMDVPRAPLMVSASAGDTTQTVTITGTDAYGYTMVEARALNGTSTITFQKAFKTITRIAVSGTMAGNLTVGTSNVLGLPVFLPELGFIVKEILDGATATAGTTVVGIRTSGGSTASTGDVRGTYIPNSAPDGSRVFQLVLCLPDRNIGIRQFAG